MLNLHAEISTLSIGRVSMRLYRRFKGDRFLSFYVEFDNGTRRSLRTRDKARASRAYRKIERAYFDKKISILSGKCIKRLGDYRDEFVEWAEEVQKRSTFRANRLALDKLVEFAGGSIYLDRITGKHIDQLVAAEIKKGNKRTSINNYIRHARSALNKAVEWEYLQRNPLAGVKELSVERKKPSYIKKSNIAPFVATIKCVHLRRFVVSLIATGRRRSELVFLTWDDIDLKNNTYTVRTSTSKSDTEHTYGINQLFKSVLLSIGHGEGRVFDRYQHPDTWSHRVKDILRAAGHGNKHLHHLRHTFATMKVEEGKTLRELQGLLGHADIKATAIYAHIGKDHLADIGEVNIGPVNLSK